jgi:hypothetical protein
MKKIAVALTALIAIPLAACSSSHKPDVAACKDAMTKQFQQALAEGADAKSASRPAACDGVDDKTLQRLSSEVMSEQMGDFTGQ